MKELDEYREYADRIGGESGGRMHVLCDIVEYQQNVWQISRDLGQDVEYDHKIELMLTGEPEEGD